MHVLHYLEESARRFPDKTALIDETESVSYADYLDRTKRIATAIARAANAINRPVVVLIDRNAAGICTMLGVAASHNFYVPIDASQPIERFRTILSSMQPALIVSIHGNLPDGLSVDVPVLEYDEIVGTEPDAALLNERMRTAVDTDPLYAICTSGSTGVPKGVLISHRSVIDFIPVFTKTFGLSENEIFGNQAPFDFDVSVKDIYSAMYLGATVYVIPKVCFVMPKKLVETLDDRNVTTIVWAVSAMCIAAGMNAFKHRVPQKLRHVMFSGEVMPIKMLNIWRENVPNATYVNLYGPTEITCNCMYYVVDRAFDLTEALPLGVPFENEDVMVLNEQDRPVQPGETGEICVRGTCLALGYYNNPERTKAAFVQNPLNQAYPERIYRTGDLAKLNEDGTLVFAARKDFQIKHMGHRIELEEIEAHIGAVEGVIRVCCLFDTTRNKIVACYSGEATKEAVIDELKKKLPKYMIPNIFLQMEQLPLTKNGKIDRKEIRAEYENRQ